MGRATSPVFRLATDADLPTLTSLINAAYRPTDGTRSWTSEYRWVAGDRISISQLQHVGKTSCLFVAEKLAEPGELHDKTATKTAVILGGVSLAQKPDCAYLSLLAVDPNCQNTGLGKALIAQAEHYAFTQWGMTAIQIDVILQRTELVAFYKRRGYRAIGAVRGYPKDPTLGQPLNATLKVQTFQKMLCEASVKPSA
jgi:ribosomal protein S18 acetylase RimI-like enzyme